MTYQPTPADLAVLREAAEYAGQRQDPDKRTVWDVFASCGQRRLCSAWEDGILTRPYAADFEHALRERLVADGWGVRSDSLGSRTCRSVFGNGAIGEDIQESGLDLLALARAAKLAGAFEHKEEV